MTPHKEWFNTYKAYDGGDVFPHNKNTNQIVGKGKVKLCFNGGGIKYLDNVLYILGLARNFLSVSNLNDFRVHVTFDKSRCRSIRGSLVIAKGY